MMRCGLVSDVLMSSVLSVSRVARSVFSVSKWFLFFKLGLDEGAEGGLEFFVFEFGEDFFKEAGD